MVGCDALMPIGEVFLEEYMPKKINIFNWLAWKDRILTLENLEIRRCNRLPTATSVLCHAAIETVDHLFLQCSLAKLVWRYFGRLLNLPDLPDFLYLVWGVWRLSVKLAFRELGVLVVKSIVWNISHARNDCMFNANMVSAHALIMKIDRLLLSWLSTVAEMSRAKMEEHASTIKRSLEFFSTTGEEQGGASTQDLGHNPHTG